MPCCVQVQREVTKAGAAVTAVEDKIVEALGGQTTAERLGNNEMKVRGSTFSVASGVSAPIAACTWPLTIAAGCALFLTVACA